MRILFNRSRPSERRMRRNLQATEDEPFLKSQEKNKACAKNSQSASWRIEVMKALKRSLDNLMRNRFIEIVNLTTISNL